MVAWRRRGKFQTGRGRPEGEGCGKKSIPEIKIVIEEGKVRTCSKKNGTEFCPVSVERAVGITRDPWTPGRRCQFGL